MVFKYIIPTVKMKCFFNGDYRRAAQCGRLGDCLM